MDGPLENKHFYEPSSSQSTFKVCSGLALLAFKKEAMIMEMSMSMHELACHQYPRFIF